MFDLRCRRGSQLCLAGRVNAGMIAVFMRDEDSVKSLRVFTHHGETAYPLRLASVDKYASIACNDQHSVAG